MSSGRFRSGGTTISSTRRRKYRSRRNLPSATSFSRSRLVAAITRTSTLIGLLPPTRSNGCPSSTRRNLAWMRRAHLADFVEHQRALVGRLELADLPLGGPGEGPSLVAEQLAGQQRFGEGGAVQADERPFRARAGVVDRPGDQFLAHAAFAADQHGGLAGRGLRRSPAAPAASRRCCRRSRSARPAARGAARSRLRTASGSRPVPAAGSGSPGPRPRCRPRPA